MWSALYTMGFAMERRRDVQSGEEMSPALITKGCGVPSMIAPEQNEKVLMTFVADSAHVAGREPRDGAFRRSEGEREPW